MNLPKNTNASRETSSKDQSFSCKVPIKDRWLNRCTQAAFFILSCRDRTDGLREGLRQFGQNTGTQLDWADKEFFIGRVDLMSAIIDTFDPELYGVSRVDGVSENEQ